MKRYLLLIVFFSFSSSLPAQLQADFVTDKTGGCSPLPISFTNTTTGNSANATYQWDFGNGNSSVLKNAGAVYYSEGPYTVTLTVKDGSQVSAKTKTVSVYRKPVIDFNFSPANGCASLPVSFTSTSMPGEGTITAYNWDFGDGNTQQVFTPTTSHTYNFAQTVSVSLTAINNYSCANTLTKSNIITVRAPLLPQFLADQTTICVAPGTVHFSNATTGPGTLSYQWDFGDGNTSAQAEPTHIYTRKGTYTVKLTATSSEGCVQSITKNAYINVADFIAQIDIPALLCSRAPYTIANTSQPMPGQTNWTIDGTAHYTTAGNDPIYGYVFDNEGPHTIEVTSNFGPCQATITKQIDVKRSPDVKGFLYTINGECGAPVRVDFKDTTRGAVSWKWNFDYYSNSTIVNSTLQSPSYTYSVDNLYTVKLVVANAEGCADSAAKQIGLSKPLVGIYIPDDNNHEGCTTLTTRFYARSTDPIVNYEWKFGDGGISTDAIPTHTYTQTGRYTVTLNYTTSKGCTGTVTYFPVDVWQKPEVDFTVRPTICGDSLVQFNITASGYIRYFRWDFGDGTIDWANNNHIYHQPGTYTVQLTGVNYVCDDTVTKVAIIKVLPPTSELTGISNTCDGTRGEVTFKQTSFDATSILWDFGDGHTVTTPGSQPEVKHTYTVSARYDITMTATNNGCASKKEGHVYVLLKQNPLLALTQPAVCLNDQLNVHISNYDRNYPAETIGMGAFSTRFEYEDGTFAGVAGSYYFWTNDFNGVLFPPLDPSKQYLRAVTTSVYFDCKDTTNYVPLVIRGGSKPGFQMLTNNVCFKSPVLVKDTSKAFTGSTIVSWKWDFGDGHTQTTTQAGITISHSYDNPGTYTITLSITDNGTCGNNTYTTTSIVQVVGPKAAFTPSATNVQLNSTVNLYNTSNTANTNSVSYEWDFGDGGTATSNSPAHTYPVAGTYTVRLIAINMTTLCRDTATQVIIVKDFTTGFVVQAGLIGDQFKCPPLAVKLTNTSINYTRLVWDFGDGFTVENQPAPAHIYNVPGTYTITLSVYGFNGLTGTYTQTVNVRVPEATIAASSIEGCIGQQVKLNAAVHTGAVSYLWDFGNGYITATTDSFATHQFTDAGSYAASLIVKDASGCQSIVKLTDKIVIHPDPAITVSPAAPIVCKGVGVHLTGNGASSYTWLPATGLDNAVSPSPLAAPSATTLYTVQGTDNNGCKGNASITVTVPRPFTMNAATAFDVCQGSDVQLNASGAHSYQWINTTTGLSNTQISNPVATPSITTKYTLVGYDQYLCYSDTADINVIVRPLPAVDAGPARNVVLGSDNRLTVSASNDVVRWNWTPADYLSCTQCPAPVSRPYAPIDYIVTVYNGYNCAAKDTLSIKPVCGGNNIYIPTAFTPNHDGKNDVFTVNGYGISIIKSFRIYNRWGEIVFERKNFYPNDNASAWTGVYKGVEAPVGAYVYFVEMECNTGEKFERKGTITLVR